MEKGRDELRKIYTFLKKETGVEGVPSKSLGSREEALKNIRDILSRDKRILSVNEVVIELLQKENNELKLELEKLKNKKWWQIWKGR